MDRLASEEQFSERPVAGWLAVPLAWSAGIGWLLWHHHVHGAPWLVVLLWPVALGLVGLLAPRRKGLRVGPDGLTELGHRRPDVLHPWSEIRGVTFRDTGIHIGVRDGSLWVGRTCRGWRRLGARIRDGLVEPLEDDAAAVSPQQICRWLGIDDDGVLVCTPGRIFALYGCPLSVIAVAVWLCILTGTAIGLLFALPVASAVWAISYAHHTVIRADGTGFSVRHGFRPATYYAWGDVLEVTETKGLESRCYWDKAHQESDRCLTVATTTGDFRFHLSDRRAAPLRDCLHELLAAREAGQRLPAGSAVTPASLSRPRLTGAEAAERGLSVLRDDD